MLRSWNKLCCLQFRECLVSEMNKKERCGAGGGAGGGADMESRHSHHLFHFILASQMATLVILVHTIGWAVAWIGCWAGEGRSIYYTSRNL